MQAGILTVDNYKIKKSTLKNTEVIPHSTVLVNQDLIM